jgi:hypothetical protein
MHNIERLCYLDSWDAEIMKITGNPLPPEAILAKEYTGRDRLIVTTNPSALKKDDTFHLRVRILSNEETLSGTLYWKQLGGTEYAEIPLKHLARNVFEVESPVSFFGSDFEYYIEVKAGEKSLVYPATAKVINQSVLIL